MLQFLEDKGNQICFDYKSELRINKVKLINISCGKGKKVLFKKKG